MFDDDIKKLVEELSNAGPVDVIYYDGYWLTEKSLETIARVSLDFWKKRDREETLIKGAKRILERRGYKIEEPK